MKTLKNILAAVLIAAAAASCQKNESVGTSSVEPMVISTDISTRTSLQGSDIFWSEDDVVAIFDNFGNKNLFTASECTGSSASFSGTVTDGTTMFHAVYPYELALSAEGNTVKVNVLSDQSSKSGSFAEEHNISVAKGIKTPNVETVEGVTFSNVCAYLKFTIPAYLPDVRKVTVSSASVMAGEMTVDFSSEEPASTIDAEGSKSITMTASDEAYEAGSTFWFVLAPVTLDGITVEVETSEGNYSTSVEGQFEMTAGRYRTLGILNLHKVYAQGASAAHTYADGILTGTDVTVNLGIPETTAAYISALNLQVKNSEGTVVRSLTKDSAAATETISADSQWPYLPMGDYTVSGTYTLSGVTEKPIETISFSITESPVFEIKSVTAYTSYDKYLEGDSTGANKLDGSTIYGVGADVTVSDAILNNTNYAGLTITDNGTAVQTGDLAGRTWGRHTIWASYTLDGVSVEGSAVVDVTGLPYSFNFYNNKSNAESSPWNLNNVTWETNNKCSIFSNGKNGNIISPSFHTPDGINIAYSIEAQYYVALTSPSKFSADMRVGTTDSDTAVATTYNTHNVVANNATGKSFSSYSNNNLTLGSGDNRLSIHHNSPSQPKGLFSISAAWWYVNIGNVSISYK